MAIEAEALLARLEAAVSEIHDHITTPEGMAAWNRLNDVDVAIRSALAEAIAQAMNDEAFVVCDLGTWSAFKGKRLLYRGYSENKARRALVSASRSGSLIHRSALAEDTACAVEGWEPIETVPKDGDDVLLWVSGIPMVAYWLTHLSKTPDWYISDGHTSHPLAAGTPTHWRLLPLPPDLIFDKEAADANR